MRRPQFNAKSFVYLRPSADDGFERSPSISRLSRYLNPVPLRCPYRYAQSRRKVSPRAGGIANGFVKRSEGSKKAKMRILPFLPPLPFFASPTFLLARIEVCCNVINNEQSKLAGERIGIGIAAGQMAGRGRPPRITIKSPFGDRTRQGLHRRCRADRRRRRAT